MKVIEIIIALTVVYKYNTHLHTREVACVIVAGKPRSKKFLELIEAMYTEQGLNPRTHMLYIPKCNVDTILEAVGDPVDDDHRKLLSRPRFTHSGFSTEAGRIDLPSQSNGVDWAVHAMRPANFPEDVFWRRVKLMIFKMETSEFANDNNSNEKYKMKVGKFQCCLGICISILLTELLITIS